MPGNIWVDSTVTEKICRPAKRYRLTAYAAKIAIDHREDRGRRRHDDAVDEVVGQRHRVPDVHERPQREVGGIQLERPCTSTSGLNAS